MINHAIGASGIVSKECKAVVEQYGSKIMDMLSSGVIKTIPLYSYYVGSLLEIQSGTLKAILPSIVLGTAFSN